MSWIRCREGTAEILVNFDDFFGKENESGSVSRKGQDYHICGKEVPRGYWVGLSVFNPFLCSLDLLKFDTICYGENFPPFVYCNIQKLHIKINV